MKAFTCKFNRLVPGILISCLSVLAISSVYAADHAESVLHALLGAKVLEIDDRPDAQLSDLYAFKDIVHGEEKLIVILMGDLTADNQPQAGYHFPSDVTYEINIDNDTPVTINHANVFVPFGGSTIPVGDLGGTIVEPKKINEDIVITIGFPSGLPSKPNLDIKGLAEPENVVLRYAGLCDDPFTATVDGVNDIWGKKNRAALVFEIPMADVVENKPLLIWGTSKTVGYSGPFQDIVGHGGYNEGVHALLGYSGALALSVEMNKGLHPRKVEKKLSSSFGVVPPDVLIYDTSVPAHYPNGRSVQDDAFQALLNAVNISATNVPKDAPLNPGSVSVCPYLGNAWPK